MTRTISLRLWLATFLAGLLITALAVAAYAAFASARGKELEVLFDAPRFALTDQLERPVRSDELRGTVVVADFVYTNCTDICPFLSARMKELQGRLRQEGLLGSRVQLLSFTVDPARDTSAVLRDYAARYQADGSAWRFLTGPEGTVVPLIVDGFHLGVQALPPPTPATTEPAGHAHPPYEVMHSGTFMLIDRDGRVRALYDGAEMDADEVLADVRRLAK